MKKLNLIQKFQRWRTSQADLLAQIDRLQKDNERLQQKLAAIQHAKDRAEKHAEDRRREKESLRARLNSQKKASELHETMVSQLGDQITELRTENEKIKRAKKKK